MNIRNIELNLLVVFDALFDERNVTRAADRLAVTQPTVSGMLKRLRHAFSDELFVRTSHGVVPTPRAKALSEPVKRLLADAEALLAPEQFDPGTTDATFRLCCGDYAQYAVVGPLIERARRLAPGISFSVLPQRATDLSDFMARGEIDLFVGRRETAATELNSRLLYTDRYVCVARKKHPLKCKRITLEQACSFDHMLVSPTPASSFTGPVDDMLGKLGYRRRVAIAVATFPALFDILPSENFLAFVPEKLLQARRSALRVFELDVAVPAFDVVANWHPRVEGDPAHRWLRAQLAEVLRKPIGEVG